MSLRAMEVLPTLKRAGAEQVAVSLAQGLRAHDCATSMVSLYDPFPGGFEAELASQGIQVEHLAKRRGPDPRMVPRLRTLFRRMAPDIIHTHSYLLRYVLPAHAGLKGRIIHTVHNLAQREVDALGRLVHRLAFRLGVVPVAVGVEVARSFEVYYGFPTAAMIPNGIDLRRYGQAGSGLAWRAGHGFHPGQRLAVCVARLEPQKNIEGLLRSFAEAFPGNAAWHLLLAGEGSLRHTLLCLAAELGLRERVHFLGLQADVAPILGAADLFVLASHWEGTPLAVMEAMASGLPVVATKTGALSALVAHGKQGLLVPPGDSHALAEALRRLGEDERMREALGTAARRHARHFSAEAMVAAYAELFRRVMEEGT